MEDLRNLARLLGERNSIEAEITHLIDRPASLGHIGEFIAAKAFDIQLHESATNRGSDGVFQSGPLAGKSVNVKFYSKWQCLLDVSLGDKPDYYLVLTGATSQALSSRDVAHPTVIDHVFLFESNDVANDIQRRGVKSGIATSFHKGYCEQAEIFPCQANKALPLRAEQYLMLAQFSSDPKAAANEVRNFPSETVLKVGCEGGEASLVRSLLPDGTWQYHMLTDESLLADFLTDEDMQGISLTSESEGVASFIQALALLERFPWSELEPVKLHSEYEEVVLAEVMRRGGASEAARWRETLARYASAGW